MIDNIILILLLLILTAKILGAIFEKIGFDNSLAELLTGLFFGVSFLNIIDPKSIEAFAIIGSVLILFIAGMKQEDIQEIAKDKSAITLSFLLAAITAILMSVIIYYASRMFGITFDIVQALALGHAFAIVGVGVPLRILMSRGLIALPCGKMIIKSAVLNIMFGMALFTILTLVVQKDINLIIMKFGGILLFFAVTLLLMWGLSKLAKHVIRVHIAEAEISLAIILVLAFAYFSEIVGFSSVLGAFIAGVLIIKLPFAETRSFSDKIKSLSLGIFVPLFAVWFGLTIKLNEIWQNIGLALIFFFSYIIIRMTITYSYVKIKKLDRPSLISASMLSVDVESLVILLVAIKLGIFTDNTPLTLFAPSVFLSTLLIIILISIVSKIEKKKKLQEESVAQGTAVI